MNHPIILFDGDCNFCRASVHWIVENDPSGRVHFAPIESEPGKRLLAEHGVNYEDVKSVVLIEGQRVFLESEAVLRVLRYTRSPWRHAGHLRWVPRPLRDRGYRIVSEHRPLFSRAAGTIDHRYEPTGPERERFLAV